MVSCSAGLDPTQPESCDLQAATEVCLPQNHRLVKLRLVAACKEVRLLALIALMPLKHAVRALERLFASLQGLVDVLQVSPVCSGECTLPPHRGQGLRAALRSCENSPGHAGRFRLHEEEQICPLRVPPVRLHTALGIGGSLLSCATFLQATRMLTLRNPRGLQYPGSNFSSSLNVLMPVWKERMQGPSHCKMRPAFWGRQLLATGRSLTLTQTCSLCRLAFRRQSEALLGR